MKMDSRIRRNDTTNIDETKTPQPRL
ncbi:MAG: hypothetical protein ACD_81C00138G0001, partial [uncultured bacterium]